MQQDCQLCGHISVDLHLHYTPSRGYSCFECDLNNDAGIAAEATQNNQYSSDQPCTKCNRRNTRPIRYHIYCCLECAARFRLDFNVYVVDGHTKYCHKVIINREKTIGVLARRVSRYGGGIEYRGVVYDPTMTLIEVGITPGEIVKFYGTPDEYADIKADH